MPAQRERDVAAGTSVAEGCGDGDGEDGWVVGLWRTGGVVVHEADGGAAEVVWWLGTPCRGVSEGRVFLIVEGVWWLRGEDGGEGSD